MVSFGVRNITGQTRRGGRSIYNRRTGGEPASKIRAERMAHEKDLAAMDIKGKERVVGMEIGGRGRVADTETAGAMARKRLGVAVQKQIADTEVAGKRHVAGIKGAVDMARQNLMAGVMNRETELRFGPKGIERTRIEKGLTPGAATAKTLAFKEGEFAREREGTRIAKQLDAWENPFKKKRQLDSGEEVWETPAEIKQIRMDAEALPQGEQEAYYKKATKKYKKDKEGLTGKSMEELLALRTGFTASGVKKGLSWGHYANPVSGMLTDYTR